MTNSTTTTNRRARRFGVTLVATALLGATACGSNRASTTAELAAPGAQSAPPTSTMTSTTTTSTTTSTTSSTTEPVSSTTTVAQPVRPTAPVDEMVGVEGERVHVRCSGSGTTTVLLIAGFEAGSEGWTMVEPALAERSRVCSYDRPGTGTSDLATATATFASQATGLHDVLATIGEPGPYVLVGHSFGGAEAVTFASEHADEVTGLVLVDATPLAWPEALCAVEDDGSDAAKMLSGLCAGWPDPNGNAEHLDVFASFAGVSTITSLGSLPMAVVTGVDRELPAGLAAQEVERLTDVWNDGQQQWSQLSTAAHVVSVDDTGHYIQLDHPDVVIDEIARLLP